MFAKALAVFVTGMPGLQKIIVFVMLEQLLTEKMLGEFSSDYSIVQMLSIFTAVGWSALILSRIPKLEAFYKKTFLYEVLKNAAICSTFFIAILVLLKIAGLIYQSYDLIFFLLSWSLYQIVRHFSLAEKEYVKISLADCLSTIMLTILLVYDFRPFIALSLTYSLSAFLLMRDNLQISKERFTLKEYRKSFDFSTSNFLSSFGSMGLPVLVAHTSGEELAGLIGFVLSIIIAMQLITRALGFYFIPEMAAVNSIKSKMEIYKKYRRINYVTTLLLFIVLLVIYIIITKLELIKLFETKQSFIIYTLLLLSSACLSITVPLQNYIIAVEQSDKLLKSSLIYFSLIVIGYGSYYLLSDILSIYWIISYLIFARLGTYYIFRNKIIRLNK